MERETFRSRTYRPQDVASRFMMFDREHRVYRLREALANGLTVREVETDGAGLPPAVLRAVRGAPHYVALD